MSSVYTVESPSSSDSASGNESDAPESSERPLVAIVSDLWEKAETLVRQEMRLGLTEAEEKIAVLKTELAGDVDQLKLQLAAKAVGGAVLFAGLLAVVAAIVLLLAEVVDPWLAALIVGVAISAGGVVLLKRELKLPEPPAADDVIPTRTVRSLKADAHTIQEATRDATN